jgi:hypothetical protein
MAGHASVEVSFLGVQYRIVPDTTPAHAGLWQLEVRVCTKIGKRNVSGRWSAWKCVTDKLDARAVDVIVEQAEAKHGVIIPVIKEVA